jgi:hypothetical protein
LRSSQCSCVGDFETSFLPFLRWTRGATQGLLHEILRLSWSWNPWNPWELRDIQWNSCGFMIDSYGFMIAVESLIFIWVLHDSAVNLRVKQKSEPSHESTFLPWLRWHKRFVKRNRHVHDSLALLNAVFCCRNLWWFHHVPFWFISVWLQI